jgi:hypothetical protein
MLQQLSPTATKKRSPRLLRLPNVKTIPDFFNYADVGVQNIYSEPRAARSRQLNGEATPASRNISGAYVAGERSSDASDKLLFTEETTSAQIRCSRVVSR